MLYLLDGRRRDEVPDEPFMTVKMPTVPESFLNKLRGKTCIEQEEETGSLNEENERSIIPFGLKVADEIAVDELERKVQKKKEKREKKKKKEKSNENNFTSPFGLKVVDNIKGENEEVSQINSNTNNKAVLQVPEHLKEISDPLGYYINENGTEIRSYKLNRMTGKPIKIINGGTRKAKANLNEKYRSIMYLVAKTYNLNPNEYLFVKTIGDENNLHYSNLKWFSGSDEHEFLKWENIPGHPGYKVSECFHVVSFKQTTPVFRKPEKRDDGLFIVCLSDNHSSYDMQIEHLAALAFLPNPDKSIFLYVVFIGDKNYHHISNIKWSKSPVKGYEDFEFRPIPNADLYKISEKGDLLSFQNKIPIIKQPYIPKTKKSRRSYMIVENDGKEHIYLSDFLVATCFVNNPNKYKHISHLDGDYRNDHCSNLKWIEFEEADINTWKTVPSFEDYRMDTDGLIKSYKFTIPQILKPYINEDGYASVLLYRNGEQFRFKVHSLVATLFCPNPENKPIVDHIDRDKSNNKASNLRWATSEENAENRDNSISYVAKPVYQVDKDWNIIQEFPSCAEAQRALNIEVHDAVARCARGGTEFYAGYRWIYVHDEELPYEPREGEKFISTVGYYSGRYINYPLYKISNFGALINIKTGLRKSMSLYTYGIYSLCHEGKAKHFAAHILVASFFVDGRNPEKCFVNHRDENKHNPHYLNLEWVTDSENKQYFHDRRRYDRVMKELLINRKRIEN